MAGDWLKIEVATPDKPEILQMADELNLDPDAVFGKVFRVWSWFDSHSEEGNAPSVTEMLLDRQVGVSGFVSAMISCGWMVKTEDGLTIPNFDNHNGQSAKKRANTARRVAKYKKANAQDNGNGNDEVTPEALADALAREEKRREELKDSPSTDAREKFVMFLEWQPSLSEITLTALHQAGASKEDVDNQIPRYIAAVIDDVGRKRSQNEWDRSFKSSVMKFALGKLHAIRTNSGMLGFHSLK